jgi:hypothetical protein
MEAFTARTKQGRIANQNIFTKETPKAYSLEREY